MTQQMKFDNKLIHGLGILIILLSYSNMAFVASSLNKITIFGTTQKSIIAFFISLLANSINIAIVRKFYAFRLAQIRYTNSLSFLNLPNRN